MRLQLALPRRDLQCMPGLHGCESNSSALLQFGGCELSCKWQPCKELVLAAKHTHHPWPNLLARILAWPATGIPQQHYAFLRLGKIPVRCDKGTGTMAEKEPDGAASHTHANGARIPRSSFQLSGEGQGFREAPESGEVSTTDGVREQLAKAALQSKAHSLHGAVAAKRQATTELLFFASVGDIGRMKRICLAWGIDVSGLKRA